MWSSKLREFEQAKQHNESEMNDKPTITEDVDVNNDQSEASTETTLHDLVGYGVGITSMVSDILISHPFLVIRHQCQVRSRSKFLHLQPFSLLPVLQNYISRQGLFSLWKGLSGALTVRGLGILIENLLSEALALPREITFYSSPKKLSFHLTLKSLSWIICTPFFAASIVEFVQSDIASEPTSLISCLMEGFRRILPSNPATGPRFSGSLAGNLKAGLRALPTKTSRLLALWRLVLPVVVLGVGQHIVRTCVCNFVTSYLNKNSPNEDPELIDAETEARNRNSQFSPLNPSGDGHWNDSSSDLVLIQTQRQEAALQNAYFRYCTYLTANFWGCLAADVICFPLETIVVRLCVQGTRTLVDNLDTGLSVLPIVSSFDGAMDVLRYTSLSSAGFSGLYRGFGALVLQYTLQAGFLVGVKYAYEQLLFYYSTTYPQVAPAFRSDRLSVPPATSMNPPIHQQQPQTSYPPPMTDPSRKVWQPISDQQLWKSDSSLSSMDKRDPCLGTTQLPQPAPFPQFPPSQFRGYSSPYDQPL